MLMQFLLASKSAMSSPLFIRPDITASEYAIESALLKQQWLLTENSYDHKQIKFSNDCIYVSGKILDRSQMVSSIVLKIIRFIHHNLSSIKILLQPNLLHSLVWAGHFFPFFFVVGEKRVWYTTISHFAQRITRFWQLLIGH